MKRSEYTYHLLESGWLRISLGGQFLAQVSPNFTGEELPDEYIYDLPWNGMAAREAWRLIGLHERRTDHGKGQAGVAQGTTGSR